MRVLQKLKVSWSSALAELLIIVVGVLVALAIDQWNDSRLDRAAERAAISGILADVRADLGRFENILEALDMKEESLVRVREVVRSHAVEDTETFLKDIIESANFGWNQGLATRSTFDDLLSAGNLGLIQDVAIRLRIAEYYRIYEDEHNRIDERETPYPDLTYRLVPRALSRASSIGNFVSERELAPDLSEQRLSELASRALDSELRDHVTSEINLGRFVRAVTLNLQSQAMGLIEALEEHSASIR